MSMAALFEANLAWASEVARRVARSLPPSFDLADLEQVARLEMWRQVQRYDPARGVPFQAFAYAAVHGAVFMSCRRRRYRDATHEELSGHHLDQRLRPDEQLLEQEQRRNVTGPRERRQLAKVREALRMLPASDAYLVRRVYLEGQTVEELEQTWGIELQRRVGRAVRALRRAVASR